LLEDEPGLIVVGEAEDGRRAVSLACQLKPDVVIRDIAMPLLNGLEAMRQIKTQCPEVKVLILSMHDNKEYIRQVLEADAMGYILKDAAARELISAIQSAYRGEAVLSPAVTRLVIED
jgi:two-component system nitrate/nitrite response regulator NarL